MATSRFEREIVRYALKEANRDSFSSLLREILPSYTRWSWGEDGPFRRHFNAWQESGFNLTPNHYYSPIPDVGAIEGTLERETGLRGVDMRADDQVAFVRTVAERYQSELDFPESPTAQPHDYHFNNGAFERVDAELLHCLVRYLQPQRVVEVGSGYSTLVTAAACDRNRRDGAPACEFIAVEPYPRPFLEGSVPGLTQLVKKPLEEMGFEPFEALRANDILFIDSTHVLKTGSDVAYLFLEILPRLHPGVYVHVHDIFLPAGYPQQWIKDEHVFWNEQYLLQSFLAFNSSFSVVAAAGYLHLKHPDVLTAAFPGYSADRHLPGSFWFFRSS